MRQTGTVRARSAIFDVYGDHLAERGSWAPVAAVIFLLQSCGISAPATRTAVSRMTAQGWLTPATRGGTRGYAATPAAQERLSEAHARIYRRGAPEWDGRWHLVVTERCEERVRRDRAAATLGYLGYGRIAPQTWLAARPAAELPGALEELGVGSSSLTTTDLSDAPELVARTWDLSGVAASYARFAADTARLREQVHGGLDPAMAYPVRARLVHRWRKFLFLDPALPAQVLPPGWPGQEASALFLEVADLLLPTARIFVTDALAAAGAPIPVEDAR